MEKFDILDFFETSLFFFTKMHFILSIIFKNDLLWLKLPPKKQLRKRLRFFHKKHRLINPLQKFDVLNFYKSRLFWSKNQSFLFGISKNNLFWLDVSKHTLRKSLIFWKKEWTQNNFGKILIFWYFFKSLLLSVKAILFYLE